MGALKSGIEDSINAFGYFETTLTEIVALSGKTGKAAKGLSEQLQRAAKAAGKEFGVGANQAAGALSSLVKAGLEGEDAMKALTGTLQLATIENIDASQAADMLVAALNQFKIPAEEAGRAVDALVNASAVGVDVASDFALGLSYVGGQAASMGFSLEDTLGAMVALNNQGIAAEKAGRNLAAMFTDLIKHSDDLGFSLYDADGSMRSLSDIIGLLQGKLAEFGSEEERNAYLTSVMGQQGMRAALALLNLGDESTSAGDAVAQFSEKIGRAGAASEVTQAKLDTMRGGMAKMKAAVEDLQLTIGEALAPIVSEFARILTEGVIPFVKALWGELSEGLAPVLGEIGAAVEGLTSAFNEVAEELGFATAEGKTLGGYLTVLIKTVLTPLKIAIVGIAWVVKNVLIPNIIVWRHVFDKVVEGINIVIEGWRRLGVAFKSVYDTYIKPVVDAVKSAIDTIAGGFKWLQKTLTGGSIWPEMWESMVKQAREGVEDINRVVDRGVGGFTTEIRGGVVGGGAVARTVTNYITIDLSNAVIRGEEDIDRLADRIGEIITEKAVLLGGEQ
ncbi:MAG: phage tail tape measure protein [Candidatus Geothermarchaeales archaeon]